MVIRRVKFSMPTAPSIKKIELEPHRSIMAYPDLSCHYLYQLKRSAPLEAQRPFTNHLYHLEEEGGTKKNLQDLSQPYRFTGASQVYGGLTGQAVLSGGSSKVTS